MATQYARVVGIVVLLLGVVGLLAGEQRLGGLVNIDLVEDLVHLASGAVLAYVGFARVGAPTVRTVVGAVGAVYLVVGLLGFVLPTLGGLLPSGYSVVDNLLHLVLGALGVWLGFFAERGRATAT